MAISPLLPTHIQAYVGADGKPTKEFYNYLKKFTDAVAAIQAYIDVMSTPMTVAQLPSPSPSGQRAIVTDALPPIGLDNIVSGGGTNVISLYSDGTNWRMG